MRTRILAQNERSWCDLVEPSSGCPVSSFNKFSLQTHSCLEVFWRARWLHFQWFRSDAKFITLSYNSSWNLLGDGKFEKGVLEIERRLINHFFLISNILTGILKFIQLHWWLTLRYKHFYKLWHPKCVHRVHFLLNEICFIE